jgi:protein phosphatase 1 regulatory subunit 7
LTSVDNLQSQRETLEELYLSHNAIDNAGASQSTGLAMKFPMLNVVDLCRNKLTTTEPFAHLEALEELWISGNEIATFDDVVYLRTSSDDNNGDGSSQAKALQTIYLEYNPVAAEFEYRKRLAEWIPSLKQIDATMIGGLAAHGMPGVRVGTLSSPPVSMEEQMRQFQEMAVQRAKDQAAAKKGT